MIKYIFILLVGLLGLTLDASSQEKSCDSIYFDDNRASLNYAALNYLNQLKTTSSSDTSVIHLYAITSESLDMFFSRRLSLRRAQNIHDYLVAIGIPKNKMVIEEIIPLKCATESSFGTPFSFVQINKN
jgi:hypothetical protein